MIHQCYTAAEILCFLHIMCCEQDSQIFAVQFAEKIPHLTTGQCIHTGSRFIKKQNFRICQKCTTNHQLTFHTAGKFTHSTFAEFDQITEFQQLFRASFDLLTRHKIKTALVFHDLVHIHILTHGIFLCDHTDLALQIRTVSGKFLTIDQDFTLCRKKECRKKTDRSCFTGTVGTEKTEKLSGLNFQIQRIYSREIVKSFCQISGFDHLCSFAMIRE